VITILSFKFEVTLFITLVVIADGKKLQYLIICCWKSTIAFFIDNFPGENGTKRQQRAEKTAETQEKQQGDECTLFSLHFLAIKRRGLYEQGDVLVLPQTLDRWQGRVKLVKLHLCNAPQIIIVVN